MRHIFPNGKRFPAANNDELERLFKQHGYTVKFRDDHMIEFYEAGDQHLPAAILNFEGANIWLESKAAPSK